MTSVKRLAIYVSTMCIEQYSYEEFVERVHASYEHPANTKHFGQVFFTKLKKERPDIASHIKDTMFDPRRSEYLHPKVSDIVCSLWCKDSSPLPD